MNERAHSGRALIGRIAGADVHYYHFDALGSTRMLTDDSGQVTDTYAYDAWGNLTGHTGNTNQPYQYVGQLGYYTHYQDANLPLLQLGVRFYDPESGRFTQVDPAGEGLSWFAYVHDRPNSLVDPSGMSGLCIYQKRIDHWTAPILKVFTKPLGSWKLTGAVPLHQEGIIFCVFERSILRHVIVKRNHIQGFLKLCYDPCQGLHIDDFRMIMDQKVVFDREYETKESSNKIIGLGDGDPMSQCSKALPNGPGDSAF